MKDKISFQNDYSEGAHPAILEKLVQTNLVEQVGYGDDEYSLEAQKSIREKIQNPKAQIHFVSGGTQANILVISALLRVHEAVVCAKTGHIFDHEAGAIEAVGHKVVTVETSDGKLTPKHVQSALEAQDMRPNKAKPRLVYISNTTELGTVYSRNELKELYEFCLQNNLLLYLDGARLGAALVAMGENLSFADIARYTDVFFIGGTKNGALLGEAVVLNDPDLFPEFDYVIKQKGAMLAKGRLMGIQFLELFKENLFLELAQKAHQGAQQIAQTLRDLGFSFLTPPESNQLFPILPNTLIAKLEKNYKFHQWKKIDEAHTAIRLVTSWATTPEKVEKLKEDLKQMTKNESKS